MEFQKIKNLLDATSDHKYLPRFVTRKWIEVYDQSRKDYRVKKIRIKAPMLRSDLCDYSDAYIVVKGYTAVANPDDTKRNKSVAFRNNAPFINCITKINGVQTDNTEDLYVVMSMYNLLKYRKKHKKQETVCGIITEIQEAILFLLILNLLNTRQVLQGILMIICMFLTCHVHCFRVNPHSMFAVAVTYDRDDDVSKIGKNKTEIVVLLKHLCNFWKTLNIPLNSYEIELILTWSKNCALANMTVRAAGNDNDSPAIIAPTGLKFQITGTKLYVPVLTLSTKNVKKLLRQLKSGFKRTGKMKVEK